MVPLARLVRLFKDREHLLTKALLIHLSLLARRHRLRLLNHIESQNDANPEHLHEGKQRKRNTILNMRCDCVENTDGGKRS